jgi:L,D-transpeptidase YcbB
VVTPQGEVVTDNQVSPEVLEGIRSLHLMVRQKPGETNSLGLVKIIFPNPENVYRHGTDAPELYSPDIRDFSHGCIRVEKPADLVAWVLRNNPGWDLERVKTHLPRCKVAHRKPFSSKRRALLVCALSLINFSE